MPAAALPNLPPAATLPHPARGTGTVWACACLLAILVALAWSDSFTVPFLLDDKPAITENATIRQWSTAFTPPNMGQTVTGRPLVNLSFALNYFLAGKSLDSVFGFHSLNLAIHLAAALALFGLVRRTLRLMVAQPNAPPNAMAFPGATPASAGIGAPWLPAEPTLTWVAFVAALIWAVHPLQTGAVTYVAQRAESMCALFYLLTLYCFARGAGSVRPWFWLGPAILACFAGMACKEVMVSAPLMVLLYDRTFVAGSFIAALDRRPAFYAGLAASWRLLWWLVLGAGNRGNTAGFGIKASPEITPWTYLLKQCEAIVEYLRLCLWPRHLVLDHGFAVVSDPSQVWRQASLLLILFAATLWALWRRPAFGFLGFWFFAILAPSSSVIPVTTETMAEHRMYLPLAAIAVAAVLAGYALARARSLLVWALVAVALGVLTYERNLDYRSGVAIWADVVAKEPANARGHEEYAQALIAAGRYQEALAEYQTAIRLLPTYTTAHANLANLLGDAGKSAEAMAEYRIAVQLKPELAEGWYGMGNMFHQMGQDENAVTAYRQALKVRPDMASAHNNLANELKALGRGAEAESEYREAIRWQPNYPAAYCNFADLLARQNRGPEAIALYRQGLALNPAYPEAHMNLGVMLYLAGQKAEGIKEVEEELRLNPGNANAKANLAAMRQGG